MIAFARFSVQGVEKLIRQLKDKIVLSRRKNMGTCTVGYLAPYAIYVHEDLTKHHPNGQAKFLELPAKEMRLELKSKIYEVARGGVGLNVANLEAAKILLEASQRLVPVDTGRLKASGYIVDADGNIITV